MSNSNITINYNEIYSGVEKILEGHGQDLVLLSPPEYPDNATSGKRGQPWGTPDLLLTASLVSIWLMQTAGKAVIDQLVKKTLEKKNSETVSKLEQRVAHLEELTEKLIKEHAEPHRPEATPYLESTAKQFEEICKIENLELSFNISQKEEELSLYLVRIGFTKRKSKNLASQLIRILPVKYIQ